MTDYDVLDRLSALPVDGPTEFGMTRICEISSAYERSEKEAVELWRDDVSGCHFFRAYVEGGNRAADLPVETLVGWVIGQPVCNDLRGNPEGQ